MDGRRVLTAPVGILLALLLVPVPTLAQGCDSGSALIDGCGSAEIVNPEVVLEWHAEESYYDDYAGESGAYVDDERPRCYFRVVNPCGPIRPGETAPSPITMSDIARFRPRTPVDAMEPNGWAIIGLDTNFYSTGETEVVDGTLLGQPASVRFIPVSWRWTYGDGTSSVASTRGASWESQGILEFDPTPTSHVYRLPGTYLIDLSVDYRAEYRFGAGAWTRIPGVLSIPANQLEATAGDAKTVLVSSDCRVNPRGSGC